ncbi:hypothetical protein ACP6L2_00965 [Sphingobacterium lactis]|uniref:hypothetical protein n=1 Tax=Sphingobacterium lactis TaxID=797291 RepID=UPI003F7DD88F
MKNKPKGKQEKVGNTIKARNSDPNKKFLDHVQLQAKKMAELLGKESGRNYIKDTLKDYPHLIKTEIEIFDKGILK